MSHLLFSNPSHIHLIYGSTTAYVFVPSLVLAYELNSPLFSPPYHHLFAYNKPIIVLSLKSKLYRIPWLATQTRAMSFMPVLIEF
jgi:hypothetical protein